MVLITDTPRRKRDADILVFARIEDNQVIIEADSTDYPLLLQPYLQKRLKKG